MIMIILTCAVILCMATAVIAMNLVITKRSEASAEIVNDSDVGREAFAAYVRENDRKEAFLLISMSALLIILFLILIISLVQMYAWMMDKKKISIWRKNGIIYERIEFLPGNRLRIDNIEIEMNKAQMQTLTNLVKKRIEGYPLHPTDLESDNCAQMIKRLKEELGCKIIEKTLIKNHRGQGYWFDVEPVKIKIDA